MLKTLAKSKKNKYNKWYKNLKSKLLCEFCDFKGSECISAIEFHHFDNNKTYEVSDMRGHLKDKLNILKEMSKCNIVCANCHRKIHENILTEEDRSRAKRNYNLNIIRKEYGRIKNDLH